MLTINNLKSKQEMYYDYEDIYEGMEEGERNEFFKQLYTQSKADLITASCTCIPERHIPLVVSKNKGTYYIRRQDALVQHTHNCKFDGNYEPPTEGWTIYPDGKVQVYLKNRIFSMKEFYNPKIIGQIELDEFLIRFLGYAWEIQTKQAVRYNRPPMQFERFFHSIYFIAEKIKFTDYTTLKDLMGYSKKHAYGLLKKRQRMFVMLLFEKKEKFNDSSYLISLKNPGNDAPIEFLCDMKQWEEAYGKLSVNKGPLLVGGFVELTKDSPLIFKRISILPISAGGVYVRNTYERNLFNKLHSKNRHFVSSFETYSTFTKYKPDVLILDTFPGKIIEIFDIHPDDALYYKDKDDKVNYFKSNFDYDVQIWDAVAKERMYFV